jgi:Cu+-exporting ATPase
VIGFRNEAGFGFRGVVAGNLVLAGRPDWLRSEGVDVSALTFPAEASTAVAVSSAGRLLGGIVLSDKIKPSAADALHDLSRLGIEVIMVTGDRQAAAREIAGKLGIATVHADTKPQDKQRIVREHRERGAVVAYAGDGINDAPALAAADVGIAMSHGTDVAIESAGLVLLHGDLGGLVRAIRLSRAVLRNIRQNLFWAFFYNLAGVPIAAGLLYPFTGWLLNPMIAAIAMSMSSLSVVANALRLRTLRL